MNRTEVGTAIRIHPQVAELLRVMVQLARAEDLVAVVLEMLEQRDRTLQKRAGGKGPELDDPGAMGKDATEKAGPRRRADGRVGMGVGEQDTSLAQPGNIRCFRLGMTAQTFDPVVEIVEDDEQHIGLRSLDRERRGAEQSGSANRSKDKPRNGVSPPPQEPQFSFTEER